MSGNANKEAAYVNVVSRATLEDILLTSSSFKASLEYRSAGDAVDHSYDCAAVGCHFEDEILLGEVKCTVMISKRSVEAAEADEAAGLFSVEALYAVVFKVEGSHSQETMHAFFNRMATFAVWPYFRAHVAGLASAANIDVPVLPIKKLVQKVDTVGNYTEQ